jgi:putative thiamine transport system ATP-binding protein
MSLVIRDLDIRLHGKPLVQGLNATIGPGEVLAVMGASGSGKSTLLAWLAGTLEGPFETRGQVLLDGRDLGAASVAQRRVGLLFQDDLLFPHMSVLENLLFAIPRSPRGERVRTAQAALADAQLEGLAGRRPHELSGGQRSRVALLRALLARPQAMLLDEPFSRLDAELRGRMRAHVFGELARRGVPTVLVTHDAQDVPASARVVTL